MAKKILVVVTSNDSLGGTDRKTGYYLGEVAHPILALLEAGITFDEIDVVSPLGGKAPMDPGSYKPSDPLTQQFLSIPELTSKLEHTLTPSQVIPAEYQAIIYAGGHGTMWDFPQNQDLAHIAAAIYEAQGVVGAICHGPSALVNLQLSDGSYLVDGKHIAVFTDDEERAVNLDGVVPFLLASTLTSRGAIHEPADPWQPNVVVDGRLVTGQNPGSAVDFGEAIASLLTV